MSSKTQLAVVALLIGFAVFLILTKSMWWKETPSIDREALEKMQVRLNAMDQDLQATRDSMRIVEDDVRRLARQPQLSAPTAGARSVEEGSESEKPTEQTIGSTARPRSRPTDALTLDAALAGISDRTMSYEDREQLWKRIREAGLTDEVIKDLEKRVAAKPKDSDAQTELAKAYLKKLQEVPPGPEQGVWGRKADEAFDRALEVDPEHWEARFTKAVSLSFWPAALGRGTEAMKNFETLVNQQERQTPHSGFESTYYFLGNLYMQMGRQEQAIATYQRGLKLFPDNAQLQQQLANARR